MAIKTDPKREVDLLIQGLKIGQERNLMAGSSAGKYGEGGPSTPVNKETMPWLYPDDEPGKDPAEIFEQLELPLDTVKRLQQLMIAHSPSGTYGSYGEPLDKAPWDLIGPDGQPMQVPWLKEHYMENEHDERKQLHDRKYHGDVSQVDYGNPTALDKLLRPAQEKYGPGLKGMPDKERRDLLIRGTKV